MHDAVAEGRTKSHREPTMKTLGDDLKILHTCTQQQHNNTTTQQQQHNTTSDQDLVSKGLHHLYPPMLLLVLALTMGPGSRLRCDSLGQLVGQQQTSARAFRNSARAIHSSARAIHNSARAVHRNVLEHSQLEDLLEHRERR